MGLKINWISKLSSAWALKKVGFLSKAWLRLRHISGFELGSGQQIVGSIHPDFVHALSAQVVPCPSPPPSLPSLGSITPARQPRLLQSLPDQPRLLPDQPRLLQSLPEQPRLLPSLPPSHTTDTQPQQIEPRQASQPEAGRASTHGNQDIKSLQLCCLSKE